MFIARCRLTPRIDECFLSLQQRYREKGPSLLELSIAFLSEFSISLR